MNRLLEFLNMIPHKILCGDVKDLQVKNAYVCDLLSDVMGNAKEGDVWITIMRHMNIIAVASLAGIPAIIFPKSIVPDSPVIERAKIEDIVLITTELSTFEVSGKLYQFITNDGMV